MGNWENFGNIQQILENCKGELTLLCTSEYIGKIYSSGSATNLFAIVGDEAKRNELMGENEIQVRGLMLQYLSQFMATHPDKILSKNYIVNSFANTVGLLVKVLLTDVPEPETLLQTVFGHFFPPDGSPPENLLYIGLKLVEYILSSVGLPSKIYFWQYRRTHYLFQRVGLPMIYQIVFTNLRAFLNTIFGEDFESRVEAITSLVKAQAHLIETLTRDFQLTIEFNFMFSNFDRDFENSTDYSVIHYGENVQKFICDIELMQLVGKAYFFFLDKSTPVAFAVCFPLFQLSSEQ